MMIAVLGITRAVRVIVDKLIRGGAGVVKRILFWVMFEGAVEEASNLQT